jgi:hypothetical protein
MHTWQKTSLHLPPSKLTEANRHEECLHRNDALPIGWINNQRFELIAYINVEFDVQNFAYSTVPVALIVLERCAVKNTVPHRIFVKRMNM